jgi:hypothetical protein
MESNENSIDEICEDSIFRKKYRTAAFFFIRSVLVQYVKYRRLSITKCRGFKNNFIFKNWKNYVNFTTFKKLRKKYIIKFAEDTQEEYDASLGTCMNGYRDTLDQMLIKVNNITYRLFDPKRNTCIY